MKKILRAGLSALVATNAAVIIAGATVAVAPGADANGPGSPGTSATPVVLYQETFENGQATGAGSAPSLLSGYSGAAPASMTYSADPYYLDEVRCDGVIASFNSANTSGWCGNNATYWNYVKGFAAALSSLQGTPSNDNHALIDFTTGGAGSRGAVVLQSDNNNLPLSGTQKRFLTMSVDVAEAYCSNGPTGNAKLNFYLETTAGEYALQSQPVQPCNSSFTSNVIESVPGAGNIAYKTGTVPALGSVLTVPANFGFKVTNEATVSGSGGNDVAYDNFTVVDATPQLDANFSSATANPGDVTNLVYTITNTSDLADKNGWAFSRTLPSGLVVNGTPTTTCAAADLSGVTGSTVDVSVGDIAQGVTSCTVTIPVSAANAGTYEVAAAGTSLTGLDAPDDTTVTVPVIFTPGTATSGVSTPQNQPITTPLANIVTATGATLDASSVAQTTAPTHGAIAIDPTTGEVTYTPAPGYSGPDSYVINVCTVSPKQCTDETIPIAVGVNAVVANPDAGTTHAGTPVTIDVRHNDTTASGQALAHPTVTSGPTDGSVAVQPDGTITYTPKAGFSGVDTYEYQVCDTSTPTPVCDKASVAITVENVFTPGAGVKTQQNKPVTTPITGIVTTTGKPVEPISVTQVTPPAHGKITINPTTGGVTYTPDPGTSGPDQYTVNVCDASSPAQCTDVVVKVTVGPNVVTAPNKSATITTGQTATFNVLGGALSKSGQKLVRPTVSKPKHGTVKVSRDGSISYRPAKGFVGTDNFTYTLCDTGTPKTCVTRTLTVHVKGAVVVPSLPDTGGPSLSLLLGGSAALLGGLVLMSRGRRRKA